MIRNVKALGLALVAVLAMAAVVASAAQAENLYMSVGNVNTAITGDQSGANVFTVTGQKVECSTAHVETISGAEVGSPTSTLLLHPTYSGCKAFGILGATVSTTGCNYKVTASNNTAAKTYNNDLTIECDSGKSITISVATCEATVEPAQTFTTGLMSTNEGAGSGQDVLLEANVTGIKTTVLKSGFGCPLTKTKVGETDPATYVGNVTVKGTHAGSQVGITVEGTE